MNKIKFFLFTLIVIFPFKSGAVQCPIPNCPAGQLCFCPPPPPHYLVIEKKGRGSKSDVLRMRGIIKQIKSDLALTSEFVFRKKFRPKSYPPGTPADQIPEWHVVSLSVNPSKTSVNVEVSANRPLGSRKLRKIAVFNFPYVSGSDFSKFRATVNNAANQIMTAVLRRGFSAFGSEIAYTHKISRNTSVIKMLTFDGNDAGKSSSAGKLLSFGSSMNKEPSWSYDGKYLVFTSHIRFNPDLYLRNMLTGKIHRISARSGVNHAAVFSPDSSLLALTLDFRGNPDVYLLKTDFKTTRKWRIFKQLTRNHAIDTSSTFSPDGKKIAFVSSRRGRAQIFLKDLKTGKTKLLLRTSHRTYTPRWCKSGSREYLAFTQLIGNKSIIFIYNVRTGKGWRATSVHAPNAENPTWSKDCNLIAYESAKSSSSKAGIWVSPIQGGKSVVLYPGKASMPAWRIRK